MVRRGSRRSADPPYERATAARNLPNVPLVGAQAGFSPMSNMSGYMHPTGSPVIGTPVSGSPAGSMQPLRTPPGLGSPVPPVPQQQQLVQTVQQQQQQITQMMTLVETLVSRQQPVHGPENRSQAAAGALSDISSIHSMEVDEGGAPITNPMAENYVPKMPLLDGGKMSKGRRSEIEAWVDYLEVFLPWIALFDDRIPAEVQKYLTREETVLNNSLPKGEFIRSTRLFLYLRQSFSNYPRGLDILKQIEREQLGVSAGYEAMRRLHQDLSVCSRIEASTLREEVLRYSPPKSTKERPLDVFRNVQVELAKYARLISGFPDLFLSEADQSMIVLKNLDVEVKRYILLHAKIDSRVELERAIKFYDANIKILNFAEKGERPRESSSLRGEGKGKGKGKEKGEKGKGKGKEGEKKDEKGKGERKDEKGKGKKSGGATTVRVRVRGRAAARISQRSPRIPTSMPTSSATIAMRWDIFRISVRRPRFRKQMRPYLSLSLREPRLPSLSCLQLRLTFLRDRV